MGVLRSLDARLQYSTGWGSTAQAGAAGVVSWRQAQAARHCTHCNDQTGCRKKPNAKQQPSQRSRHPPAATRPPPAAAAPRPWPPAAASPAWAALPQIAPGACPLWGGLPGLAGRASAPAGHRCSAAALWGRGRGPCSTRQDAVQRSSACCGHQKTAGDRWEYALFFQRKNPVAGTAQLLPQAGMHACAAAPLATRSAANQLSHVLPPLQAQPLT